MNEDRLHRHQLPFDYPLKGVNPVVSDEREEELEKADPEKLEMPWGKFQGMKIMMLKGWYLEWLIKNVKGSRVVVEAARRELQYRDEHP